jgi:hypothetical protein
MNNEVGFDLGIYFIPPCRHVPMYKSAILRGSGGLVSPGGFGLA